MEASPTVENLMSKLGSSNDEERVFNPRRFALARRRRGLNKTELATQLNLTRKSINNYEAGLAPSPETLARIASTLKFPEAFFYGADIEEIETTAVSFRSMARMTAARRDEAESQGSLCLHLNDYFAKRFAMPAAAIPDVRHSTPEAAAAIVRTEWALGVRPVSNMIQLLESKGVRIFSLSVKAREVDAFSTWKGPTPFIMLNVQKSSEHSRFDAAHELAHLVLHRDGSPTGKEAEGEANRFASAFLMPEADVLAHTRANPSVSALIQWKRRWGVSLAALNYRMHDLRLTTEYHYRNLCMQISSMGGRTREIDSIPRERSLLLEKMLRMLAADGITRSQIAREIEITTVELDEMMFGLTMTALKGSRSDRLPANLNPPKLQLV
jgi:Zn-dependent peptidase ImmA (M78 family)/DNA-binding XRE family transcriptional regulator